MLIAAAVMALASCQKEQKGISSEKETLHFTVRTAATKTYISETTPGTYAVNWRNGDQIGCFTGTIASGTQADFTLANNDPDGATATFDGSGVASAEGNFKAVYPASAIEKGYSDGTLGVNVKGTQAPTATSFDPAADILVSQAVDYMSDGSTVALDDIFFSRILSVVKVNVKGTAAAGEKIASLKITAPAGTVLTGRAAVNMTDRTIDHWTVEGNTVEGKPSEDVTINSGTAESVYLLVNPTTIASGEIVNISGATDSHSFSKDITLGADLVFPAGQIAVINLTLNAENLSASESFAGEYILTGVKSGVTYAAKAWIDGKNNLSTAKLTETDAVNHLFTATNQTDDFKFTLTPVAGNEGYYTIQDANGMYLYAASPSRNYLKGSESITAGSENNFYFAVSENADGTHSVVADMSSNRNNLMYNTFSNIFSCYASGQSAVTLYPYANLTIITMPEILSVSPASLVWATDDGTAAKTFDVNVLNATSVAAVVDPTTDFTVSVGDVAGGVATVTVTPKAAAGATARTATVSITASDGTNTSAAKTVELTQNAAGAASVVYTLDGNTTGTGNNYAAENDITQSGIAWKVTGNTAMAPWRIGGKQLSSATDRAIYSTAAIADDIVKIEVLSGETATITVNSLTVTVHNSAADAASGANPIATVTESTDIINSTVTLQKTDATSWANKYYRIVYNVGPNSTKTNKYVQFASAKFYSE